MWSGWALYLYILTKTTLVEHKMAEYNFKQECFHAKEELSQTIDLDNTINRYVLVCQENNQLFDNSMLSVGLQNEQ
jgi:hypothetical protein